MTKVHRRLLIMIDSGATYFDRREAIRNSWLKYYTSDSSPIPAHLRESVEIKFVVGINATVSDRLAAESAQFGDIVQVGVADAYDTILRKMLVFLTLAVKRLEFDYFMHADDDSFVRLDLLLGELDRLPAQRVWWGYFWNLPGGQRWTRPLRNPVHKSYMPVEQYSSDEPYPPFASGCGFVLSSDLAGWLAENAEQLPDYRLVDAGCGLYLANIPNICMIDSPHVRPYRPLPMFHPNTIVQHYMTPEEFRGYYQHALDSVRAPPRQAQQWDASIGEAAPVPAATAPTVAMKLYEQLAAAGVLRR